MNDAPVALEFASSQGQANQRSLLQLFLRDPGGENAHPQPQLHQFLDGLHAPQLDDGVQHHVFLVKVFLHGPEGITVLVVEHITLFGDLLSQYVSLPRPGMHRADDEVQFVGEERMKIQARFLVRFEGEGEVNLLTQQ